MLAVRLLKPCQFVRVSHFSSLQTSPAWSDVSLLLHLSFMLLNNALTAIATLRRHLRPQSRPPRKGLLTIVHFQCFLTRIQLWPHSLHSLQQSTNCFPTQATIVPDLATSHSNRSCYAASNSPTHSIRHTRRASRNLLRWISAFADSRVAACS